MKQRLSEGHISVHLSVCCALSQWTLCSVNFMYHLRRLVVLSTWALNTADNKFKEDSERIPLFLLDLVALIKAQRKTQWAASVLKGCGSPQRVRYIITVPQCRCYRKQLQNCLEYYEFYVDYVMSVINCIWHCNIDSKNLVLKRNFDNQQRLFQAFICLFI